MLQKEALLDINQYKNKLRVRVCGILIDNHKVLLLKHTGIGKKGYLWSPPGGGVDYKETAEEALVREFKEETNIDVLVSRFLFVNEFIDNDFHAIELFFEVSSLKKEVVLGNDPELSEKDQILSEYGYFDWLELTKMDNDVLHNLFRVVKSADSFSDIDSFISFKSM